MSVATAPVETAFFADEERASAVFRLLDHGWPSLAKRVGHARRLGFDWRDISRPFAIFQGPQAVAHAGVVRLEAELAGKRHCFAGVHAVCTHPDWRHMGYCRRVMAAALRWCDEHFETVILFSERAALYERFGFRTVPQARFAVERAFLRGRSGFRRLTESPGDVARLRGLLQARSPVSSVYGPVAPATLLPLNEILMRRHLERIHYSARLGLAAAFERTGGVLRLYDLAGPRIPGLDEIVGELPGAVGRVETWFAADRLGGGLQPQDFEPGPDRLMVRGRFPPEGRPFLVPLHARC